LIFWFAALILHRFSFFNTIGFAAIIGLIFYSFQGLINTLVLIFVALTCYIYSRVKKKFILFSLILFTPLFLFKYLKILYFFKINISPFFVINFIDAPVPPGLSFASFSAFALLIILKKNYEHNYNSLKTIYGYLFFFPHLIAGPIVRPKSLIPQLNKFNPINIKNIIFGIFIFSIGFGIKAILADSIAQYIDPVFSNIKNEKIDKIIISIFLFSQQIFFDFNGYTLMAIGIACSFGITLPENFNTPYLSTSISDFWKRWHITLSNWIRDFIYIPLGGSKCSRSKHYFNLMFAMIISGVWHGYGLTFLLWGFLHGSLIIFEKIFNFNFVPKILKILTTYLLVTFLWIFFRISNLNDLNLILNSFDIKLIISSKILLVFSVCIIFNYLQKFLTFLFLKKTFQNSNKIILITASIFLITFCLILSEGSTQKFIYFNF
jgi:alginate O-acetyltransferase complex protein AlgI